MRLFVAVAIIVCTVTASAMADGCCGAGAGAQPMGGVGDSPPQVVFLVVSPNGAAGAGGAGVGVPVSPNAGGDAAGAIDPDFIINLICQLVCKKTSTDQNNPNNGPIVTPEELNDNKPVPDGDNSQALQNIQDSLDELNGSVEALRKSINRLTRNVKALRKAPKPANG